MWTLVETDTPDHKDLVLCSDGELVYPAIYYSNRSFTGFYYFTSFYKDESKETIYSKVRLKEKFKMEKIVKWMLFPKI